MGERIEHREIQCVGFLPAAFAAPYYPPILHKSMAPGQSKKRRYQGPKAISISYASSAFGLSANQIQTASFSAHIVARSRPFRATIRAVEKSTPAGRKALSPSFFKIGVSS